MGGRICTAIAHRGRYVMAKDGLLPEVRRGASAIPCRVGCLASLPLGPQALGALDTKGRMANGILASGITATLLAAVVCEAPCQSAPLL